MSEGGPKWHFSFHGPGSLAILVLAIWMLLYALANLFKTAISPDALGIVAFIDAILLFVGV